MYTCCMCKKEFSEKQDQPFVNGAGKFCPGCKKTIHQRAAEGQRRRVAELEGRCMWCREKITEANAQPGKTKENVCYRCSKNRDWLLACIRRSDHPAKYAARAENRERDGRELNEKKEEAKIISMVSAPVVAVDQTEARLSKMEEMLSRLSEALGV